MVAVPALFSLFVPVALCASLLGLAPGCSLLVDSSAAQCRSDGDCARFTGSRCDRTRAVCVAVPVPPEDAGTLIPSETCRSAEGCKPCPEGKKAGFANACSDSTCVAFAAARITLTGPDGGLRSLPAVSP